MKELGDIQTKTRRPPGASCIFYILQLPSLPCLPTYLNCSTAYHKRYQAVPKCEVTGSLEKLQPACGQDRAATRFPGILTSPFTSIDPARTEKLPTSEAAHAVLYIRVCALISRSSEISWCGLVNDFSLVSSEEQEHRREQGLVAVNRDDSVLRQAHRIPFVCLFFHLVVACSFKGQICAPHPLPTSQPRLVC